MARKFADVDNAVVRTNGIADQEQGTADSVKILVIQETFPSREVIEKTVQDINAKGIATVPDVINKEVIQEAGVASDIEYLYNAAYAGSKRKSLMQPDLIDQPGNIVNQIWASSAIHGLADEILTSCGANRDFGTHYVINALDHRATVEDYGAAHFDACYLTFLLPLKVVKPINCGEAGKLRIWPNAREFTKNRLLDSVGCRLYSIKAYRNAQHNTDLDLEVGNLYAFYGFRTFHQIVPIVEGIQRVTMLMHFGSPRLDRIHGAG